MEVQKSANCDLRGYFNQLFLSCRAGNIYTALLHVVFICATRFYISVRFIRIWLVQIKKETKKFDVNFSRIAKISKT